MSIDQEVEALKRVPILRGIDQGKLRLLAFISERVVYGPGEVLCKQGDIGDSAFIILDGEADVVVDTDDGPKTVAHVGTNDIVGEIAILCDVPRTASVVANSEVHALTITKDQFLKMMTEFPEMAIEIMRVLATRLERTTHDLADLRSQMARQTGT
ncbi:MAG: Crp/Fnr family transcriptional regulator [Rhodobiaceae bacterium]|nr:Crp/Fnr family transcriptional regulator [Rhodobiaceae bacterium]